MNMKTSVYKLTTIALITAVLCVLAPLSVPIGPVPVSLATFVIYLFVYIFGTWMSTAGVAVYLLIGLVGIPVFSGYTAGVAKLAGPTGGFLVGYLLVTIVGGLILDRIKRNVLMGVIAFFVSTILLYALGTVWYIVLLGGTIAEALMICVVPFIVVDIIKMAAAAAVGEVVRKMLVRAEVVAV